MTFVLNSNQRVHGGSLAPALTAAEFLSAAQQAAAAWSEACEANIRVVLSGTTSSVENVNDSVNVILWDDRTTAEGNMYGDTAILAAAMPGQISDTIVDCDIVVNGEFTGTFGVYGESNKYDLVSTLTHEIGHCLGLDHPIEPPSYDSTNQVLRKSSMVQTAVAGIGSTFRRTINQDDNDAIVCMYQTGASFRSGNTCGSYHGTSGGAAISGMVTGGPSADAGSYCTYRAAPNSVQSTGETGGGCISHAIAGTVDSDDRGTLTWAKLASSFFGQMILLASIFAIARLSRSAFRRSRGLIIPAVALLSLAGTFGASKAQAMASLVPLLSVAVEERWMNPVLLNHMAEIANSNNAYPKFDSAETFRRSAEVVARVGVFGLGVGDFGITVGVYGRYLLPAKVVYSGTPTIGSLTIKETTLKGFAGGPFVRANLFRIGEIAVALDAAVGAGSTQVEQTITMGSSSSLAASAFAFEAFSELLLQYPLTPVLALALTVGYSRQRTNAMSVSTVSGSQYSSLRAGDRLAVLDGGEVRELRVDRSGWLLGGEVAFHF